MRGTHAAFEGQLGREAELRTIKQGKPWLSFSLAVDTEGEDDALTTWVRVAYFGEDAESLVGRL
jgi:single-stranded DNA-binding protein